MELEKKDYIQIQSDTVPARTGIISNIFAATLYSAGIRDKFISLQKLLMTIENSKHFIIEFADGTLFQDLLKTFKYKEESIFENSLLYGDTIPLHQSNVIMETRENLRRTAVVVNDIKDALDMLTEMYNIVNRNLSNSKSTYYSRYERTEPLVTWALRNGVKLNNNIKSYPDLVVGSKSYVAPVDLWGLIDLFDTLRLELETLLTLPAYYQTGTNTNTQNLHTPVRMVRSNKHQSIEALSQEEFGDTSKVNMILEFNELKYSDVSGDNWDGREIMIPDIAPYTQHRKNNMVLDAHNGAQILGRDLSNDIDTDNGDLKPLSYSDTFLQSVENIIRTPYGSIVDSPKWGSRATVFIGSNIGDISVSIAGIEIARAIQTDPRVEGISDLNVTISDDKYLVQYRVQAINQVTVEQLSTYLET